jgi:translation initiation factor IF-1
MSTETIETTGIVTKVLGKNNYRVEIGEGDNVKEVLCYMRGKMSRFRISIVAGDEVTVEIPPPYDRGRITYRGKK